MGIEFVRDEADKKLYDPFEVKNKQPGRHYRLLNKNSRNLDRKLDEGYTIVGDNDPEKLANLSESNKMKKGTDLDTTQRFGDTVLAWIPEEKIVEKRKQNRKAIERLSATSKQALEKDAGSTAFEGGGGGGWGGSMSESEFNEIESKSKGK